MDGREHEGQRTAVSESCQRIHDREFFRDDGRTQTHAAIQPQLMGLAVLGTRKPSLGANTPALTKTALNR